MSILGEVTRSDVERRGLTHKSGVYILSLEEVTVKNSRAGNRYLNLRFKPISYALSRKEKMGPPDHAAPLFDAITPVTQDGVNRTAAARIVALIAALTREDDLEKIKKDFDADSVEELAKKIAQLCTLRCQVWVAEQEQRDNQGNLRKVNKISNFEPVPEEVAAEWLEEIEPEEGIPF